MSVLHTAQDFVFRQDLRMEPSPSYLLCPTLLDETAMPAQVARFL